MAKAATYLHPVLAYPCFDKPFVLHTDASGQGRGAVLEQEQGDGLLHPVAYASRTVSKHEARYGITDLEALGVVWAAKHFGPTCWGISAPSLPTTPHCEPFYGPRINVARWPGRLA